MDKSPWEIKVETARSVVIALGYSDKLTPELQQLVKAAAEYLIQELKPTFEKKVV